MAGCCKKCGSDESTCAGCAEAVRQERDEARRLCRICRAALGGDHAAAAVLALVAEDEHPWLNEEG